jgi:hypothetical protein
MSIDLLGHDGKANRCSENVKATTKPLCPDQKPIGTSPLLKVRKKAKEHIGKLVMP